MNPNTYDAIKLMQEGSMALARAERNGIHIDMRYCHRTLKRITRKCDKIDEELRDSELYTKGRKEYGKKFNPESNEQLAYILYEVLGHDVTKTTATGKNSTDEEALRATGNKDVLKVLEKRKLTKVGTTYIGGFVREQINGIIHPFFHLHFVRTFRGSSSNPNFQNIPNRDPEMKALARTAIIPRPGHMLLAADFSGVEVRVATCYHKDPEMIKYNSDSTKDMHRDMAMECYKIPQKLISKVVRNSVKGKFVFAQFYGDYWKSCAQGMWQDVLDEKTYKLDDGTTLLSHMRSVGLGNLPRFESHIEKVEKNFWGKRFPKYAEWKEEWWDGYQERGYFDTLTGFRCGGIMSRNDAINYPVQGSAFHCLLWSLTRITEIGIKRKWRSHVVAQIHDEIVMDVHPDELEEVTEVLNYIMQEALLEHYKWIIVPIEVEIEACPVDWPLVHKNELVRHENKFSFKQKDGSFIDIYGEAV